MPRQQDSRPGSRDRQRALTRSRIIDAAVTVFDSRSALTVTMTDIAAAAGVTRPTVYAHFPQMADIIEAVLDELYDLGDLIYGQLAALPQWTPQTLRSWLDDIAVRYRDAAQKMRVTNLPGVVTDRADSARWHRRYIDHLASGPRWAGVDPAEAEQRAFMLVLTIETFFIVWIAGEWPLRTADPIALLTESVVNILRPAVVDA